MSEEQQKAVSETTFTSNGEIGALIRSLDWSQTPLGSAENWSQSLKATVQILSTQLDRAKQQEQMQQAAKLPDRQRTEVELRTQSQLLETIVNHLPSSVAIVRGRDLTFQFVNPMYQAIAPGKQMVGRTVEEVWSETQPIFAERCRHVLETGEPYHAVDEAFEVSRTDNDLLETAYFSWSMHRVSLLSEAGWGILITIWETTERKQVEAELRQSNDRFYTAMQAVEGIVFEWNLQTQTIYRSKGLFQLIGVQTEDAPPTKEWWMERIHPDDIKRIEAELPAMMTNGDRYEYEYRVRHQAGHWIDVWERGYLQRNPQGEVVGIVGFTTDISERRQAEASLRLSEERYRLLTSTLTSIVWTATPEGALITPQPEWEAYTGQPWENHQNWGWLQVLHPEDRGQVLALWPQAIKQQSICRFEGRMWHAASNEYHYFEAQGMPLLNPDGSIREWIGTITDIHDRKQAEAALQESKMRLDFSLEAAQFGDWDLDLRTHLAYRSLKHDQIFGYESLLPEWTYEMFLEHVLPEEREDVDQQYRVALENKEPWNIECRIYRADQQVRWIWVLGYVYLNAQGEASRMVGLVSDITDRKQAETILCESENRFRQMADSAPVLLWMSGPDKFCYYFNLPWLNFTGRTMEQEVGNGWAEGVHPDDFQRCLETYVTAFDARQPFKMEYRLRRFDGIYRCLLDEGVPRYTSTGQFLGYIGSCIDIEDQKQTEDALRESESQFRLIVDSAKEHAIFTMNLQGYVTKWNSGAERLLGYTEAEAIGCSGEIIFTSEDNEQGHAESEIQTALMQGRATNERWHLRKDGSRFWASGLMMPLLDEMGTPQGVVNILQDKTVQRQASERLQLLHETIRDLLSTDQPLALIQSLFTKLSAQLDLHYYFNYMVEEKSDRSLLHLRNYDGMSEEEAQAIEWIESGQYLCGMVAQEQRQIVFDEAQIATNPNARAVCALGIRAYAGQPLIAQGQLLGTLSFASRTRTHFTSAEVELLQSTCDQIAIAIERTNLTNSLQQQAEQLRQANRIKDEFLAVLSHELRSPLNPILGWSKLLRGGKLDSTKTAQALATIERNAKLQAELIEDLLDVSRILQGKLCLNVRSVNLSAIVRAAIETMHLAAEAKSVTVEATLDPEVGQVSGDATRLQQVIWNLLSNAVKFTPQGGHVAVQLKQAENQAQITISDTGKGILPDFVPHVFDYFRQEDGATTRKFGGLGLGLAIVRHLVELHGGTVQVASPGEGLGATFTVKLPLMPVQSAVPLDRQPSEPLLNLDGIQVLVIDDETDSREFVAFVLEQAGARVTAATSAGEGFAILTQSQPDVLLSDIGMPDMDGYMLMQQVRRLPSGQGGNVVAIALTAYAGDFNQQQALQAGFQQHLAKPIEPEALIRVIANLTKRPA